MCGRTVVRNRTLSRILIVSALFGLAACEPVRAPYDIVVANCGDSDLTNVELRLGTNIERKVVLQPGSFYSHMRVFEPVSEMATLRWQGSSGQRFMRQVPVRPLLPQDFGRDEIVFQIPQNGEVQVRFRPSPGSLAHDYDSWRRKAATTGYCLLPVIGSPGVPSVPSVPSPVSTDETKPKEGE
jgi:hypothetical protein